MQIPMSSPDLTAADVEAVTSVLETRYLSLGPRIVEFEERFAAYVGARHAIGVSSGTTGLHLCVIAAGVEDGDLVITSPFSFVSSANCILFERAIPIFVDIDPHTFNINPALVAQAAGDLARGGNTAQQWLPPAIRHSPFEIQNLKALLPVDIFGQPADMDPILDVARKYNLAVIEDACEAIGAEYKGCRVGSLNSQFATCTEPSRSIRNSQFAAVFAFYPNKQMTTGEGGMIVTDDEEWANLFRSLRNQGRDIFDAWLNHSRLGYNYRLGEMNAALGLAQLGRIEELLAKRERVAQMYNERLCEVEGVTILYVAPETTRMSWFVYVVRLAPEIVRNRIMADLEERGVPSRPYFTPIHLQKFYRERFGYREGDFPVTEAVARSTLALPFSSVMTEEQVDYVCGALKAAICV